MEIKTLEGTPCYLGTWRLEAALFRPYFISTSRRSTFVLAFCVLSMFQNYKVLTRRWQQIISDCPSDILHLQTLHLHYRAFCSRAQTKHALYPVMCCQEWAGASKSEVLAHFWKCPCYFFYCDTWWVPIWYLSGSTIKNFKTKICVRLI